MDFKSGMCSRSSRNNWKIFFVFDHLGVLRLKTPRKERNGFYSERNGTERNKNGMIEKRNENGTI